MQGNEHFVCDDGEKRCLIAAYRYMKGCMGIDGQIAIDEFESRIRNGIVIDNDLLMYSSYSQCTRLKTDDSLYLTNYEQR